MGVIVAATHLQLEQQVALKVFRGDLGVDQEAAARFKREAKAAAQIRSEHVARVLDAGVAEDEIPYIVMEYLEGRTLDKVIAEQGPLEVQMAVEIIVQACEGLAEAHARGIVHRDIKPSNLFLVERSHNWQMVKLLDFGISKVALAGGGSVSGSGPAPDLSTKVMMGTPCYMSPEQLRSTGTVDHRSDIWSLGATLYELLAGTAPFDPTQGFLDLADSILLKPLIALRDLRREVPEALDAVVARCLSKDRRARYDTAGELAMALLPFAPPRSAVHAERAASIASMARNPPTTPAAGTRTPTGKRKSLGARVPLTSRWAAIAMGVALAVFVTTTVTSLLIGGRGEKSRQPAPGASAPATSAAAAAPVAAAAAPPTAPLQSELVVRATPASAQILIDGVAFTQNPVRRRYPRGSDIHRVAAYADGYEPNEQDVSMANDVILDISLHRRRVAPPPPPPARRASAPIAAASGAGAAPRRPATVAGAAAPAAAAPAGEPAAGAPAPGVDPTGGRAPLHRIVTRNPYETP
jgi:serine/threonine-protein kinase